MSETFFKESDCDQTSQVQAIYGSRQGFGPAPDCISLDKANRILQERGTVVINIEPIEKDSAESLLEEILFARYEQDFIGPKDWREFQKRAREVIDRAKRLKGESK